MRRINGNCLSQECLCVCSAGEVLADFLRTETRKESNLAGRWALSGRRDMACGTRKIGGIPAQCGESTDVKKPNREGLGFESGGQVPRHHEPSFRPHARSVAQFPVHERFVALGSHYPHLRTRLGFSPSTLVRHSGQHTHDKTTTYRFIFTNFVDSGSL